MKVRRRSEPDTGKPLFALKARRIAMFLGIAAVLAALIQLMLGASPVVTILALTAVFIGLFGFMAMGPYNLGSWVMLFYTMGNVLVALYAKTLLGQPLGSNLYAPVDSFLALVITSAGLLLALLLVRRVGVGRVHSLLDLHYLYNNFSIDHHYFHHPIATPTPPQSPQLDEARQDARHLRHTTGRRGSRPT